MPPAASTMIRPAAFSTRRAMRSAPSRADGAAPEVSSRSTPRATTSSNAVSGVRVTSKARWKVTLSGRAATTSRSQSSMSIPASGVSAPMTTPSAPATFAVSMSRSITATSDGLKMKSPPRGRMITWTLIRPAATATACSIMPALGVIPPSNRAAQSSTRSAPASAAAATSSAESRQISKRTFLGAAHRSSGVRSGSAMSVSNGKSGRRTPWWPSRSRSWSTPPGVSASSQPAARSYSSGSR